MAYQKPTLFGLAYASRPFHEVDGDQAFETLCRETGPALNLRFPDRNGHAQALLKWLNNWGCRIAAKSPDTLFQSWSEWFRQWKPRLPPADLALIDAGERDFEVLADAYGTLLPIYGLGPTGASKLLLAVRPASAMAWDAEIQKRFAPAGDRAGYGQMLARSKAEAEDLAADAARCGVTDWRSIADEIGRSGLTLPKLLDEYHWVTITRRHQIPAVGDLQRWMAWHAEATA
jgi:hypothetical protein